MSSSAILQDLVSQVKKYRKTNPNKFNYPETIKDLVRRAVQSGSSAQELSKLTGISWGAIKSWSLKPEFRELEVRDPEPEFEAIEYAGQLIFRYPTGLEIEVSHESLTPELIKLLKGA